MAEDKGEDADDDLIKSLDKTRVKMLMLIMIKTRMLILIMMKTRMVTKKMVMLIMMERKMMTVPSTYI